MSKDTRTVTLPAGRKKGSANAKPNIHPTWADAFIELAGRVNATDTHEMIKAAQYVHKLGLYLKSDAYSKAKAYRLAAKARWAERNGVK